ncbi:MAG: cation transporter [Oligoflexia bacterium]|nr:cation transporter [Oligoflexia bacterium]
MTHKDHCGDHEHHHNHHHHSWSNRNKENASQLKWVIALTLLFMVAEVLGGLYTGSLALMSDAAHMLTDAAALSLSLFAFIISNRPATAKRTFGYLRMEILAAFLNGLLLAVIAVSIVWGAIGRLQDPGEIKSVEMFWISLAGLAFNLAGAWILTHGDHTHLNVRGALFHVMGDALGSLGAIIAAVLIYFFGLTQADAIVSIIIALIILASSYRLILDTTHVILEGTPRHLDIQKIQESLEAVKCVKEVHDLHVWTITSGVVCLSVHVVAQEGSKHDLLLALRDLIRDQFGIDHVTIQIEDESLKKLEPLI